MLGIHTQVSACSSEKHFLLHTGTTYIEALADLLTYGFIYSFMVAVLSGKIIDQFEAAKQQLITASAKWQLMEQLFARSQLSSEFLRRTGSDFPLLRDSIVADAMISLGRFLDKSDHKGNHNLTLERLMTSVSRLGKGELALKLGDHLRNEKSALEATGRYRHERLAQNELNTILGQDPIPLLSATVGDARTTLREAGESLDAIDLYYRISSTAFDFAMIEGDPYCIVRLIRDG
jgi:hypothetical protein